MKPLWPEHYKVLDATLVKSAADKNHDPWADITISDYNWPLRICMEY